MSKLRFDHQECLTVVAAALEDACRSLAFAFPQGVSHETRAKLVSLILEAAFEGERSPKRLCAFALQHLPPLVAAYPHPLARLSRPRPDRGKSEP